MAEITAETGLITAADGTPLKVKLRQTQRRMKLRAFWLVLPLFAFIMITFIVPIGLMVFRSIDNPVLSTYLPNTLEALETWDDEGVPDEETFAIFASEMLERRKDRNLGKVAGRLNYQSAGMRSLFTGSARKLARVKEGPWKEALIKINKKWGKMETWATIKQTGARYTTGFYLSALDFKRDEHGGIAAQPEELQIYKNLYWKTLWVSLLITVLCLLLAYPISYLMATLPLSLSNLLMIMVLLPFWTSLLVRTTSWIVLLQREGVLNDIMVWIGILGEENRLQMIYNLTGTVVAMVHILLPFMVLPLYSVMKTISPNYVRAAQSLGATPARAFWKVYFPQSVPGIGAGSILVFILAIGYYITPALVGGKDGQLISAQIAYHMQKSLNWGLAAALGGLLLFGVLALYWLYNRIVGIDNMKLG
jgi:putative spermidine/putrescine transport system permease protein